MKTVKTTELKKEKAGSENEKTGTHFIVLLQSD